MRGVVYILTHPFEPIFDEHSRILILGTFPSVKSRELSFYYSHPRNRFWQVVSDLTHNELPLSIEDKKALLLKEGIALWDVLKSCDIDKSSDSSITNPVPNDLNGIFRKAQIRAVFTNGRKAQDLYIKFIYPKTGIKSTCLPSTSPANAGYSFERLKKEWSIILEYLG